MFCFLFFPFCVIPNFYFAYPNKLYNYLFFSMSLCLSAFCARVGESHRFEYFLFYPWTKYPIPRNFFSVSSILYIITYTYKNINFIFFSCHTISSIWIFCVHNFLYWSCSLSCLYTKTIRAFYFCFFILLNANLLEH